MDIAIRGVPTVASRYWGRDYSHVTGPDRRELHVDESMTRELFCARIDMMRGIHPWLMKFVNGVQECELGSYPISSRWGAYMCAIVLP